MIVTVPKYIRNVRVYRPDGVEVTVDIEIHGRPNSEASLELILYKGRRITPYEQRLRGWRWTLDSLFKRIYSDKLADLFYQDNPFLNMIPKDYTKSAYYQPVILNVEKVEFK